VKPVNGANRKFPTSVTLKRENEKAKLVLNLPVPDMNDYLHELQR
jgi:hypothetical protein